MKVLRKGFTKELNPTVSKFVSSVKDDTALVNSDIDGSLAHADMLKKIGLLTPSQAAAIMSGLATIKQNFMTGEFCLKEEFEDVHMNVEKELQALIGVDALRLHSARSRNDQVALDTRLFAMDQCDRMIALLQALKSALVEKAKEHKHVVMPGYTHLQRAQPVLFAHAMLAFKEMFERDIARFINAKGRTAISPLGAGAQAGTALPIEPHLVASNLKLSGVFANSIDAVTDRDFVAEFVFCASLTSTHLSQLAETLIIWSTKEFGFITFDDSVTTTSSLMPQKKNPDPIEIVRGKSGSIFGELISVLTTLKGLPLGYNRDLQEVKTSLINTAATLSDCLTVMTIALEQLSVVSDAMLKAASDPEMMTTDLVEYLVLKGMPFREAHELMSQLIADCREGGICLSEMDMSTYKSFSPLFEQDLFSIFDPRNSVNRKVSPGGTGTVAVNKVLAAQ